MLSCGLAPSPDLETYVCLNSEFITDHARPTCVAVCAGIECPESVLDACPEVAGGGTGSYTDYVCFTDAVPESCRCTELGKDDSGLVDVNPIMTNAQAILYGVAVVVATFSVLMMPHKMPVPLIRRAIPQTPPQTWLGATFVRPPSANASISPARRRRDTLAVTEGILTPARMTGRAGGRGQGAGGRGQGAGVRCAQVEGIVCDTMMEGAATRVARRVRG